MSYVERTGGMCGKSVHEVSQIPKFLGAIRLEISDEEVSLLRTAASACLHHCRGPRWFHTIWHARSHRDSSHDALCEQGLRRASRDRELGFSPA
jgi:hypothetical protein